jgi:hypothetical protein
MTGRHFGREVPVRRKIEAEMEEERRKHETI